MDNLFYTYAYLREDGTPYYIGKGHGKRAFSRARKFPPPPKERILLLKQNLTEEEAFKHEIYMIAVLGRKDLGTGILWNFTDGGEGVSGRVVSSQTREKLREASTGKAPSDETREKLRRAKLGKKQSQEQIQKAAAKRKGSKRSPETREKMRTAALLREERKRNHKLYGA